VADALHWHLSQSGITYLYHYLDDYIVIAPPQSPLCQSWSELLLAECAQLGVPIASPKTDGLTTVVTFLGILIDTDRGELRLPQDKLQLLRGLLDDCGKCKACTCKELESLSGLLNPVCMVVRAGRSFLRRMIDLLHAVQHPLSSKIAIRLSRGFKADLAWWQGFLEQWNEVSFLIPSFTLPQVRAYHRDAWFQVEWDSQFSSLSIAEKELVPSVSARQVWGFSWSGCQDVCHCDHQALVADMRSWSSKHKGMTHLLQSLVFAEARLHCYFTPCYITSKANHLADDLSHNISFFISKVSSARGQPTLIADTLLVADTLFLKMRPVCGGAKVDSPMLMYYTV